MTTTLWPCTSTYFLSLSNNVCLTSQPDKAISIQDILLNVEIPELITTLYLYQKQSTTDTGGNRREALPPLSELIAYLTPLTNTMNKDFLEIYCQLCCLSDCREMGNLFHTPF